MLLSCGPRRQEGHWFKPSWSHNLFWTSRSRCEAGITNFVLPVNKRQIYELFKTQNSLGKSHWNGYFVITAAAEILFWKPKRWSWPLDRDEKNQSFKWLFLKHFPLISLNAKKWTRNWQMFRSQGHKILPKINSRSLVWLNAMRLFLFQMNSTKLLLFGECQQTCGSGKVISLGHSCFSQFVRWLQLHLDTTARWNQISFCST